MALSDEERRRIYEEEMTRARARERIKNRQLKVDSLVKTRFEEVPAI